MATPSEEIDSAYRRALRLARERSFRLTRQGVERLYRAFAEAIARLADDETRGTINPQRAMRLRNEIDALLRQLQRGMVRLTEESVGGTIVDIVEIHNRLTSQLFRRYAPGSVGAFQGFDSVPVRALAAMLSRPNAATFRTLFNRRINALAPEIDAFLDAAVARGVATGRAAKDLAAIMAKVPGPSNVAPVNARAFDEAFRSIGRSSIHRGAGTIDFDRLQKTYGLVDADVKQLRTLIYDARRIIVSETNSAHTEATAQAMSESPVVLAAQWQLSGRHSTADVCDVLAGTDSYGFGAGFYPPDKWPPHPHPHCGCYQGRARFRRPSEWAQPKPASPDLGIDPNQPEHSAPWAAEWTDNQRERYQAIFAASVRFGERARRAA